MLDSNTFEFKISLLLITFVFFTIANNDTTIVISLGTDCTVASVLRDLNLRHAAYPFDWMYSSFQGVCQALADDFSHFLEPESLKLASKQRAVTDYYGFLFVHDFPTIQHEAAINDNESHEWAKIRDDWQNFTNPIREKYQRRIERLRKVFEGNNHVLLIRYDGALNKECAIELRQSIIKRYPKLNFTIVDIEYVPHDDPKSFEGLDKIKAACIQNGQNFWNDWKNLFDSFGVNPQNTKSVALDSDCNLQPLDAHKFFD